MSSPDLVRHFGRHIHAPKNSSVSGREANLTTLYRHAPSGFEVYFLNTLATPHGKATIVTRSHQK